MWILKIKFKSFFLLLFIFGSRGCGYFIVKFVVMIYSFVLVMVFGKFCLGLMLYFDFSVFIGMLNFRLIVIIKLI